MAEWSKTAGMKVDQSTNVPIPRSDVAALVTTRWVARAADSGAGSTWSLTVTSFPSRSTSPNREPDDGRVRFDKQAYRMRCTVEQCIGWLKEYRRVATRFEKYAVNFLAMIQAAIIQRYLRVLFSDTA